jgi:hypothetical protein
LEDMIKQSHLPISTLNVGTKQHARKKVEEEKRKQRKKNEHTANGKKKRRLKDSPHSMGQ